MKKERKIPKKILNVLNSKPIIGIGIFIMLSLAMVFAGNVIVKDGSVNVDEQIGISQTTPQAPLHIGEGTEAYVSPNADLLINNNGRADIVLRNSANDIEFSLTAGTSNNFFVSRGNSGMVFSTAGTGEIVFDPSSGTDELTIGNGQVDIAGILDVNGPISTAISSVSSTYTVTADDSIVICETNYFTVNLPTASGINGRQYTIKRAWDNSAPGSITIDGYSTQTIDGSSTYSLGSAGDYVVIVSDGSNWVVVGNN